MSALKLHTGEVKHVISDKGPSRHIGWITPDDGGPDMFFHILDGKVFDVTGGESIPTSVKITRTPRMGDKVIYAEDDSSERFLKAKPWGYADGSGIEREQQTNAE